MRLSPSDLVARLAEPLLALATLAPLLWLVERWSLGRPHAALPAVLLGSLVGLLLVRRGWPVLAGGIFVAALLLVSQLGSLWPPFELLAADLRALLGDGVPAGAVWHWLRPATSSWIATLQSDRRTLLAVIWHTLLLALVAITLWRVRRTRTASVWPLVLPPLAWLAVDVFLRGAGTASQLLWALGCATVFVVTRQALAGERRWAGQGFSYSEEIRRDVLIAGTAAGLLTIALSVFAPTLMEVRLPPRLRELVNAPWQLFNTLTGGRLEPFVKQSGTPFRDRVATTPDHRLSGQRLVSDEPVLQITLPDVPVPQQIRWRSWTLDAYDGHTWRASDLHVQREAPAWGERRPGLTQIVQAARGHSLVGAGLPAAPGLVWTNGASAAYVDGEGNLIGALATRDRFTAVSTPGLPRSGALQPLGGQPEREEAGEFLLPPLLHRLVLRAVGGHPVREVDQSRYVALPPGTPLRVRVLAHLLTRSLPGPEAKLAALEQALQSLRYDTTIPTPPRDRDAVDWFLFEQGRGYCDYFASAFVVMARVVGLPARFVTGYAPGTFDPATRTYLVRERQAHSWAEVWLPERGWVEFDPTPAAYNQVHIGSGATPATRLPAIPWLPALGVALPGLLLAVGLLRLSRYWRRTRHGDALAAWAVVQERAALVGLPPAPSATPAEQAARLAEALRASAITFRLGGRRLVLRPPDLSTPLAALASAYGRARYGPPGPVSALPGWRRLLRPLWWLLVRRWRTR
ncbi:MAG TPA: transglutaminase domain-containing protein [Ardenticatenaceae bacterium]|nr:transglutaminase domain-containing protein [Ardenticatenaceae bacterium]